MESSLHQTIYQLEKEHWWYAGRRRIIFDLIDRLVSRNAGRALDIGCGSGLNASILSKQMHGVVGIEISDEAIAAAKKTAPALTIIKGSWPDMVIIEGTFDLITCFDVLEHIKKDGAALKTIESLLSSGGIAILTMPAFQFLWSDHDTVAHHVRRYTKRDLHQLITTNTSLDVVRISYFNSFLFFPIVFFRALKKVLPLRTGTSDIFSVPRPVNAALTFLFGTERYILRHINFPLGVSLLCVLKKR